MHQKPGEKAARERLAYDEVFASQLALMLLRASNRRRRGIPVEGRRRPLRGGRRTAVRLRGRAEEHERSPELVDRGRRIGTAA